MLMSKQQVAAEFGVSPRTIDNWRADPDAGFPEPLTLPGAVRRWRPTDISAFIDRQHSPDLTSEPRPGRRKSAEELLA